MRKNELVQMVNAAWEIFSKNDPADLIQPTLFETWLLLRERARRSSLALAYPKNVAKMKETRNRLKKDWIQIPTRLLAQAFLHFFNESAPGKNNLCDLLANLSTQITRKCTLESLLPDFLKGHYTADPKKIFYTVSTRGKAAIERLSSKGIRGMSFTISSQKVVIYLHGNLSFEKVSVVKKISESPFVLSGKQCIHTFDFGRVPEEFLTSNFVGKMPDRPAFIKSIDSLRLKPNQKRLI